MSKQPAPDTIAPERLEKLKEIYTSMDTDNDGSVDIYEYRSRTTNETMLKLFAFMDSRGDQDGELSLEEWLNTMSKVGVKMTDEEFERDLGSMLKKGVAETASLAPERLATLKEIFAAMDADKNGAVDFGEYRARTSNDTMLKLFGFMDAQANNDGLLTLDKWLGTMSKVGSAMSDEEFERDLGSMLRASMAIRDSMVYDAAETEDAEPAEAEEAATPAAADEVAAPAATEVSPAPAQAEAAATYEAPATEAPAPASAE